MCFRSVAFVARNPPRASTPMPMIIQGVRLWPRSEPYPHSLWLTNIFSLKNGYNLEVSGWYNIPSSASFYNSKGRGAVNLGLQKSFLNNRWNVQLNINDIFRTSIFRANIKVDNSDLTFTNVQVNRTASLRLTYNFGKSKFQSQGRKSGVSEDAARLRK